MRTETAAGFPATRLAALLTLFLTLVACSTTQTLTTVAPVATSHGPKYAAYVVDASSGRVLHETNGDAVRFPASLTKMMTLYLVFEAIDEGRLSMGASIPVSSNAARQPPSKLGLRAGDTLLVRTAVDALIVKSANDVAVAVAEHLAGSEQAFAARMTAKARELGMGSTVFRNASGLPDPGQRTTARDMAGLGLALMRRFPGRYPLFAQRSFVHRGKLIRGHNKLLGAGGVDGIKTGYIRASGYNIVTSARRDGRRLLVVVMGGESAGERNDQASALLDRYFAGRLAGVGVGL